MSSLEDELLELGADITPALEDVGVSAALLDKDGVILWQNKISIDRRGDHVGTSWAELAAPGEQPAARDILTRILCRGEPAELTVQLMNAEGGYTPIQFSGVPVRGGGSVVAIFGMTQRPDPKEVGAKPRTDTHLTQRQLEILRLLADGRSTLEIASQLHLSPTTVRNHVAGLLAALGVHTRLQAVVAASRAGFLDP
jgi:DNA-binding CsgD family transcriptional regulator